VLRLWYLTPSAGFDLTTLAVIGTDCTGSCKYRTITTTPPDFDVTVKVVIESIKLVLPMYNNLSSVDSPNSRKQPAQDTRPHIAIISSFKRRQHVWKHFKAIVPVINMTKSVPAPYHPMCSEVQQNGAPS
jgi:hypothetical protein